MRRGALDAALAREAAAAAYDLVALPARRPGLLRRTLGLGAARGLLRRSASSLLVLPNAQRDTPFPSSPTRQVET
jgi:nucleotide-binding universal stress UspA family protein